MSCLNNIQPYECGQPITKVVDVYLRQSVRLMKYRFYKNHIKAMSKRQSLKSNKTHSRQNQTKRNNAVFLEKKTQQQPLTINKSCKESVHKNLITMTGQQRACHLLTNNAVKKEQCFFFQKQFQLRRVLSTASRQIFLISFF